MKSQQGVVTCRPKDQTTAGIPGSDNMFWPNEGLSVTLKEFENYEELKKTFKIKQKQTFIRFL